MRFYGNEICCGSYACLNAMQDPSINLQLFEISTSTPFGIRHFKNEHFDRLLTTYCDPNQGMDRALYLWGYAVETIRLGTPEEAVQEIRHRIRPDFPVIVGPIDMGQLGYQIMSTLLKRMDHYILLEYYSDIEVYCTDSEGFYQYRLTYEELRVYLSADVVPEANGCITIRQIKKKRPYKVEEVLEQSLLYAADNLRAAEKREEGSKAIMNCCRYLEQYKEYKWRLPFMYDIQYLKQRKLLLLVLIDLLAKYRKYFGGQIEETRWIVNTQNDLLGKIYGRLQKGMGIDEESIEEMAWLERKLEKVLCMVAYVSRGGEKTKADE